MDQFYIATFSAVVSVMVISIILFIKAFKKAPPLPPGPWGFPVLGYLPFLVGRNLMDQLNNLGNKYGPIFKLYLGNKLYVVISSPTLVKDVVRDQDAVFSHRDTPAAALVASYGGNGHVFSQPNSQWRAMRKIFAQEMMSSSSLEASYDLRRHEVRRTIRQVHSNIGEPVQIGHLAFQTELGIVMKMLWGGTIAGEEAERIIVEFCDVLTKLVDIIGKPNVPIFIQFLQSLIFKE